MTPPLPARERSRTLLHQTSVLDLFAGPGGWDFAAQQLGLDPLGIEWDDAACATRKAAGLRTEQADVSMLRPLDYGPIWGLIGSPPCQAWSMAGKGGGRRDKDLCVTAALELAAGADNRGEHRRECEDERSMLVVEPLRFALDLRPRWIALEQVPPVLEMWTLFAQILTAKGYSVWAGVLEAERYGVPQTRERAILLASLDGPVHPPAATHQRYVKGEPPRHDVTLEGEILPWISMAQALGWDEGSAAYRLARGEGMLERHGDRRAVPDDEPAPVVTSKARTASWVQTNNFSAVARDADGKRSKDGSVPYVRPTEDPAPTLDTNAQGWTLRTGMNSMSTSRDPQDMVPFERPVTDPAPTLDGKVGSAWKVAPPEDHQDAPQRWKYRASTLPNSAVRDTDEPAPTVLFGHASNDVAWVQERPAPSLPEPKYRKGTERQWNENAVRVTVEQASILQTFPPDYPWQGSRTKQFEQVGNAIPPLLAWHVLRAIVDEEGRLDVAA